MPHFLIIVILTMIIGSFAPITGFAADVLPGAAQAEQMRRALSKPLPIPKKRTSSSPIQSPVPKTISSEAEKITFKLKKIILEGNHVYTTEQLLPLYQDKLNKVISIAMLFQIEEDITSFYRDNGYILSRAILTPQHIKEGIVTIKIIEGYVDKVTVSGDPKGAKTLVQKMGEQIAKNRPLQLSVMEKYLYLANAIPATIVRSILGPSTTQTGAADLDLNTNHSLVTGYVSYDNYGTAYLGPQQMTGNIAFNSFLVSGDAAQFTLVKTAKESEMTYGDLNYNLPLNAQGDRLLVGANSAKTRPQYVLAPEEIVGLSTNYYTTWQHPIFHTPTQSLALQTSFNYVDNNSTALGTELYTDDLRVVELAATYAIEDPWLGQNNLNLHFRQGLPILGYSSDTNPATAQTSNPGGTAVFSKIALQAGRLQEINGPFSMLLFVNAQLAFNPLLTSEQFTFGGSQLGRGYDIGEIIGDSGIAGSAELHYQLNIKKLWVDSVQLYTFYDIGMMKNHVVTPNTIPQLSASSTGVGVRFAFKKYFSGNLMWAQPLTKVIETEALANNDTGNGYAPRVQFSLVASLD